MSEYITTTFALLSLIIIFSSLLIGGVSALSNASEKGGPYINGTPSPHHFLDVNIENNILIYKGSSANQVVSNFQFSDQQTVGNTLIVDSVKLSEGGFIVLRSRTSTGRIIGVSNKLDPSRDYRNIPISLSRELHGERTVVAMLYADSDDSGDFDRARDDFYTANGRPVTTSATVVFPQYTESTRDPTPTETQTASETVIQTEVPRTSSTQHTTPGSEMVDRGFFTNGADSGLGFLDNALNITIIGFALSIIGILLELRRGG